MEQFGLQFKRNLSYLVQKNRAAVGDYGAANTLRDCCCECAVLMSEELFPMIRTKLISVRISSSK
jgi:hypothetical protein